MSAWSLLFSFYNFIQNIILLNCCTAYTGRQCYSQSKAVCDWRGKPVQKIRSGGAEIRRYRVCFYFTFTQSLTPETQAFTALEFRVMLLYCSFPSDHYLRTVTWVTDERLAVQWLPRRQDSVLLQIYDYDGTNWKETSVRINNEIDLGSGSFFCWSEKKLFWKMLVAGSHWTSIIIFFPYLMATSNCLVTTWVKDKIIFHFWVNNHFNKTLNKKITK